MNRFWNIVIDIAFFAFVLFGFDLLTSGIV